MIQQGKHLMSAHIPRSVLLVGMRPHFWLVALAMLLVAAPRLYDYVRFDVRWLMLVLATPLILQSDPSQQSNRYGYWAMVVLIMQVMVPSRFVYLVGLVCALLYMYESRVGKVSVLPLMLVGILSPLTGFATDIFGFEIRLYLTELAAQALRLISPSVSSLGNVILLDGAEFSVDPACMGLTMVATGLYVSVLLIGYQQHLRQRKVSSWAVFLTMALALMLVVLANLIRIISIVIFKAMPGTFAHEVLGVAAFGMYVLLPLWFWVKWLPMERLKQSVGHQTGDEKYSNAFSKSPNIPRFSPQRGRWMRSYFFIKRHSVNLSAGLSALLLFLLMTPYLFGVRESRKTLMKEVQEIPFSMEGYSASAASFGVMKLEKEGLLVYVKPPTSFYELEHSPILCWKGSGYRFEDEQIKEMGGRQVYFSQLVQGEDVIYTAWWFDSGEQQHISQLAWRLDSLLSGTLYYLVNVSSHDPALLEEEVSKW